MKIPPEHSPLSPTTKTGFGFEEIMRNPDYSRFTDWYARFSFFAQGNPTSSDTSPQARVETAVGLDAAA
jgi:hypothetical protein